MKIGQYGKSPLFEITWAGPSAEFGILPWLLYGWNDKIGEWQHLGFRILGFDFELHWIWMSEQELDEWQDLCRDENDFEAPFELQELDPDYARAFSEDCDEDEL